MAFRLDDTVRILRSTPPLASQYRENVGSWVVYMSIPDAPKP
jgi:hypothetical protein